LERHPGNLSKNVALSVSVIATGGSSRTARRVYAYPTTSIGVNNHAYNYMKIGEDAVYGAYITGANASGNIGLTAPNGASVEVEMEHFPYEENPCTRDQDFWTGLDFSADKWNYTDLWARSFPRLAWE
jgi:hypothetical protein